MSYHSPWEWTDDQLRGFKDALRGLDIEYKVFQMDTKRNSTEEQKQQVGEEARSLIESWKPDMVYTTDDNAQEYVAKHYANNGKVPFVFAGVNAAPENYGFAASTNITGVLEHEHFIETVTLLKEIAPNIERIAVIVDPDPTWNGVTERMKTKAAARLPDVQLVGWDAISGFADYQSKVKEYQTTADALALLGIHGFKDSTGTNVPWQEVLRWTTENSTLPDFSFWKDRIPYGTLCAVYVSGYEQGLAAGKIVRGILAEGRAPSSYPIQPTIKGEPIVSLARSRKLGIALKSDLLLSIRVVEQLAWEQ